MPLVLPCYAFETCRGRLTNFIYTGELSPVSCLRTCADSNGRAGPARSRREIWHARSDNVRLAQTAHERRSNSSAGGQVRGVRRRKRNSRQYALSARECESRSGRRDSVQRTGRHLSAWQRRPERHDLCDPGVVQEKGMFANAGKNCRVYDGPKATGTCYRNNFGEWQCSIMADVTTYGTSDQPPPSAK